MFLVHADLAEAVFAAERPAGLVEQKNARQQFLESQSFGFSDERRHQQIADAPASPVATDIDREFANAAITMSRRVRTGAGPPDNIAIEFGNHRRVTAGDGLKPGALIRRGSQIGLKRADPVLDALIVDFRNRGGVVQGSDANL